jgi:hypothetical protein
VVTGLHPYQTLGVAFSLWWGKKCIALDADFAKRIRREVACTSKLGQWHHPSSQPFITSQANGITWDNFVRAWKEWWSRYSSLVDFLIICEAIALPHDAIQVNAQTSSDKKLRATANQIAGQRGVAMSRD